MAERSDAPLADEPQSGAVPNDMPVGETSGDPASGMPAGSQDQEPAPGGTEDDPGHRESPFGPGGPGEVVDRGEDAQPGFPSEGEDEPFSAG